ncbi:MAG TPA: hypothetical protein DDW65_11925 [Firmicutes bacterium]|jgi:L-ascorbate 6-phosphate lactonase|nr:hypothetical protein [Bacillota bacterium]
MDFLIKLLNSRPRKNEIALFWLGQAGFVIKDSDEKVIVVDPYLSDCVERIWGYKRLMMPVISPNDLKADIIIATHHHEDHLDIDAIPILMSNSKTQLFGSKTAVKICQEIKIEPQRLQALSPGDVRTIDDVEIHAVYADHGEMAPDAIGFILTVKGIRIYFTGDTAYRPLEMECAMKSNPDILIFPINGAFGNLNAEEAAKLASQVKARITIPSHFWTFAEHFGDPYEFEAKMKEYSPDCQRVILCQGEEFRYVRNGKSI